MRGLNGLRVMVTGAGGGIGAAIVARLADEGAIVAGLDLRAPDHLEELAVAKRCDVTVEDEVRTAVGETVSELGGVDGLVAAAGMQITGPTHEFALTDFRSVLESSAVGTFVAARAVLPTMIEQGDGRIVTFGSTAAVCAAPGLAAYAAAKGAVLQFTRSLAVEYAEQGIRANCLCPGGTMTPMLREIDAARSGPDHFREAHPIKRYAEPEEIAATVAFLLSDDASFVLGTALMVDGGYSAR